MTTVAEAWALVAGHMPRRPVEHVPIGATVGRILAAAVEAERDQPPFDRVTMDGIAIASEAWARGLRSFPIAAVQAAGQPASRRRSPDACVRVMTGAVRPEGTDAVIPIERVRIADGVALVDDETFVEPGRFIHAQGSDRQRGDVVLEPGIRIGPAEIAVLASAGRAEVATSKRARIAVISTGDELVAVDAPRIEPYQIRSSNDLAIVASLERASLAECSRTTLPDDPKRILESVSELHDANDMLILSGGVSMGEFDFVPAVLAQLEARVVFHRIEQKPGKPMWFGLSGQGKPIFALPGNPVSTLLCMTRYVVPALRLAAGVPAPPAELAVLGADVEGPKALTYFVPVVLGWSEDGVELALPKPTNTSGDFSSLAATDGFIELPAGRAVHERGSTGRVWRW
ncbi:MAG TPA: molybdopterin molybdotransferase MoeA [Gammaproteobacteria bacterium]|nr:molybdopterin molybdotransferase MoeA [Gammaproteobacteria bacterium]